jgi:tripartite-type tricarboxylate transporter receptor subunit TctC
MKLRLCAIGILACLIRLRRRIHHMKTFAAVLSLLAIFGSTPALAQTFPSRPITIVVPFAAGGPTQPIVIENVAGANGNIGVGKVARAPADGYTISIGHWSTHVVNGAVYALPHDVLKDFEPVSLIATNSYLIVARNGVPANDLKTFIGWLRANPGKALEGTAGSGSPQHVGGVFFQQATGTRFQFIPYKGAAPAMQALLAGEVDMIIDDPTSSLPQVRGGRIKAFAVTAKNRLEAAPDIPTVDEAGLAGFYFSRWHALWVPKGTPKDVVTKLNASVVSALTDQAVRSRLADLGQEIFPREQLTPAALGAYHKAEIEKWWPIIKAAGIKAE